MSGVVRYLADREDLATLRAIRDFMQKRDTAPFAWEIGAAPGRHWPANKERAASLANLLMMGLVKQSSAGRVWLTDKGREAIGEGR